VLVVGVVQVLSDLTPLILVQRLMVVEVELDWFHLSLVPLFNTQVVVVAVLITALLEVV
jgi:hypothetical protein